MKNTLVIIGWVGGKRAYLNLGKAEAIRRYLEDEPEDEENIGWIGFVQEFPFDDTFCVYDAWGE